MHRSAVMQSVIGGGVSAPPRRRELRHPAEPWIVTACVALNVAVIAVAIALVWLGAPWLAGHPFLEGHVAVLRAIGLAGVFALPATVLGRHRRLFATRGNGIRLSRTQLQLCHERLLDACHKLGIDEVPELYLAHPSDIGGTSASFDVVGGRAVVALSTELFGGQWEQNERAIAFAIGHALGALRLGHTRWWMEMLTAYAVNLPFLRTPIRAVHAFSRDRCGAFVEPNGIQGLIIHVAGKAMATRIDVPSFVEQAMQYGGFWAVVAAANRKRPHLMVRARLLYEAKLFDLARDTARHEPAP